MGGPRGRDAGGATAQTGPLARAWLAGAEGGRIGVSTGGSPGRAGVLLEQEGRLEQGAGLLGEGWWFYEGEEGEEKREKIMAEEIGGVIRKVSYLTKLKRCLFRRRIQEGGIRTWGRVKI